MSTMTIELVECDTVAYERHSESSLNNYANAKVQSGHWDASDSLNLARREFSLLLPNGRCTPGHHFRSILMGGSELIGYVWFAVITRDAKTIGYLYDIYIAEEFRGNGWGFRVLDHVELELSELGACRIELHVFVSNTSAISLYRKHHFKEVGVTMAKLIP